MPKDGLNLGSKSVVVTEFEQGSQRLGAGGRDPEQDKRCDHRVAA